MPWSTDPLELELPRLLAIRKLSLRQVATEVGVSAGHLSRVARGQKTAQAKLLERLAARLNVDPDHFPEYRALVVCEHVRRDAELRDRLYRELSD